MKSNCKLNGLQYKVPIFTRKGLTNWVDKPTYEIAQMVEKQGGYYAAMENHELLLKHFWYGLFKNTFLDILALHLLVIHRILCTIGQLQAVITREILFFHFQIGKGTN